MSNYPIKTKEYSSPRSWPKDWTVGGWVCPMAMIAGVLTDDINADWDIKALLGCYPDGACGECDTCGFRQWVWETFI